MKDLDVILKKALEHYQQFQHEYYVVSPALPIVYFGDLQAYLSSKIKIVTVGKNPADIEFRLKDDINYSFIRFLNWEQEQNLQHTLGCYFEHKPYKSWFDDSYEPVLKGITASYYSENNQPNRAIHTDICSPLATKPRWSKLKEHEKSKLFTIGFELWKELINILEPDALIISVSCSCLSELKLEKEENFESFNTIKDGRQRIEPYVIKQYEYNLLNGKITKVFFGKAAQKPFGTLAHCYKELLGQKILQNIEIT
jgi:hypothetical protein